jgi:hypothetical protein
MEKKLQEERIVNHYEAGSNCQVFNGAITNCVFAMPGSNVTQQAVPSPPAAPSPETSSGGQARLREEERDEELFHFIHPAVQREQEWAIHDEVKHLVVRHSIQDICQYLQQMASEMKILLPLMPSVAYAELVRMGMPQRVGYNENTFRKYYSR